MKKSKKLKKVKKSKKIVTEGLIPIFDCVICINIQQKYEYIEKQYGSLEIIGCLPNEMAKLINITDYLKKCPLCGTYYYFISVQDRGGPLEPSTSTENLIRYTPAMVRELFFRKGLKEEDKQILLKEDEELEKRYDKIISELIAALKDENKKINWHIKKYIIEVLTDHLLFKKDWESLREVLLNNWDLIVRVETAYDIIYLATEKYPVWVERDFTKETQEIAKEIIHANNGGNLLELLKIFADGINNKGETIILDAIFGYRKVKIAAKAYSCLSAVQYYDLDISLAIPEIINWLSQKEKLLRQSTEKLLEKFIQKKKENAKLVLELIDSHEIDKNIEEVKKILKLTNRK